MTETSGARSLDRAARWVEAYGALDKARYAIAHGLHIANHQDEIVVA